MIEIQEIREIIRDHENQRNQSIIKNQISEQI